MDKKIRVKINGSIKEFQTLQGAINYILHQDREQWEIYREHGEGD